MFKNEYDANRTGFTCAASKKPMAEYNWQIAKRKRQRIANVKNFILASVVIFVMCAAESLVDIGLKAVGL